MRINGFYIFLILFLFSIGLASIYYPLRYIRYILPAVPFLFFLNRENDFRIHRSIFNYFYSFLVFYSIVVFYLLIQNLIYSEVSGRFLPNAVFILSPLLAIFLILPYFNEEKINQYIRTILFVNVILFFYEEGAGLFKVFTNFAALKNALITSEMPTESNLAYVFGFFVLYLMLEKYGTVYKIIAIIFFILCFKRVAIAGVVVCLAIYFFLQIFRINLSKHRKKWALLGVFANLAYIKIVHLLVLGTFDKLILEKTGFSADRFLMGRKTFYTEAFERAGAVNLFGLGLGKIDDFIFSFFGIPVNLHSEVLRNYFEFGLIVFTIWLWLLFYKNLFSNKAAIFLLYFNVLILTDNVFIYFDIMFYFYFFILIFLNKQRRLLSATE